MKKRFYSVEEFQELFGIGRSKALALIKSEGFPAIKIDRTWHIDGEKLDEWISKRYGQTINTK